MFFIKRVAIGQISSFELPAGMIDDEDENPIGTAVKELEEECGIRVDPKELIDLTGLALSCKDSNNSTTCGIAPSGGACDELVNFFYLEKKVTKNQLDGLRNKLIGASEFGEFITLHVVPWDQVWKLSNDAKTMVYVYNCFFFFVHVLYYFFFVNYFSQRFLSFLSTFFLVVVFSPVPCSC